jgi:hypothetical protein
VTEVIGLILMALALGMWAIGILDKWWQRKP